MATSVELSEKCRTGWPNWPGKRTVSPSFTFKRLSNTAWQTTKTTIALSRLQTASMRGEERTYTLEEVREQLDLDDWDLGIGNEGAPALAARLPSGQR